MLNSDICSNTASRGIFVQAQNLQVCTIDDQLILRLKNFRFRKEKTNAAVVMKIDLESMTVVEDTSFDETELEVSVVKCVCQWNKRYNNLQDLGRKHCEIRLSIGM